VSESFPFPIYSGLLEPKHYNTIGQAVWLFLWLVSSTTKEIERDGVMWGVVLGNKPIKVSELEKEFGVTDKTVRSWIKTLEKHNYIKVTRAPYGLIFTIRNSKKYVGRTVENNRTGTVENDRSKEGERKNFTDPTEENYRSNKDITEDPVVIIEPAEILKRAVAIEKHFLIRRGKGSSISVNDFEEVKKLVAKGIPVEIVMDSIDKTFAEYKPNHEKDEIRTVSYCIPRCYNEWAKNKVDESITGAVPHVPVAIGSTPKLTKQQQEIAELERFIEEERRGNRGDRRTVQTH
jgi:predicted transcriptional regulator